MNVSKGDMAISVSGIVNVGIVVEVIMFIGPVKGRKKTDYWFCRTNKLVMNNFNQLVTEGLCSDSNLRRICPPQNKLIPDPIEETI